MESLQPKKNIHTHTQDEAFIWITQRFFSSSSFVDHTQEYSVNIDINEE